VSLDLRVPEYGDERRQLRVSKLRGREYRGGYHDYRVARGGVVVFPRLRPEGKPTDAARRLMQSGVAEVDEILGGGLHSGTSTLFNGPSGAGKSSVATQFAMAAVGRGERVAMFIFEETLDTFFLRCDGLGMAARQAYETGQLTLEQIDPARLSPGEFAARVAAEALDGVRLVVIDSLNGYLNAMSQEKQLIAQLHDLLMFLSEHDVTTLLVLTQAGVVGDQMVSPLDVSYLADTVVLFRYFEATGEVRKAMSVLKRRTGGHERAIRELEITPAGLRVGPPLYGFQGVLGGVPELLTPPEAKHD
jgi:circadian clock protein KaiC